MDLGVTSQGGELRMTEDNTETIKEGERDREDQREKNIIKIISL